MNIKNTVLKYIIFQRTSYLPGNKIYKLLSKIAAKIDMLHKPIVVLKAFLYQKNIKAAFQQDMENEYQEIKNFLPTKADHILDIGSGIAGIDIFLSRHYNHQIDIHLLDKTAVDKTIHYYFEERGSFYNSLDLAKQFLMDNQVPEDKIHLHEVNNDNSCFALKYDLIISLISWGFHYPLSTYLTQVKSSLAEGGVLIIDIRKDSTGLEVLRRNFNKVHVIADGNKKIKIAAIS